jgi:hypothetical protein
MRVVAILGTCLILGASACSKKGDAGGCKATVEIVDGVKTVKIIRHRIKNWGDFKPNRPDLSKKAD